MAFNTIPFHGKVLRIEKTDVAMEYTEGWEINVEVPMGDASRGGQHWEEGKPGQGRWNGSFNGSFVAGNTQQKAFFDNIVAAIPGVLLEDVKFLLDASTNAFTGNIYITGLRVGGTVKGITTFTVSFTGDGALTLTDAA